MSAAEYDRWRQPERVIAALGLAPGMHVADVGAGAGYLTLRLARAVSPGGRVTATDIDPAALAELARRAGAAGGRAPIEVRQVAPDDPGLEAGSYDRVLLAEVDQLLPDRAAYLDRLRAALAPGGRVAVENRIDRRAALMDAAARAGYAVDKDVTDLPGQFLVLLAPRGDTKGEAP
jgi:cyclopropane fatty-acyl-phospholipid synthase-like methyltransferase